LSVLDHQGSSKVPLDASLRESNSSIQFESNLDSMKKVASSQAHQKKVQDDIKLASIEIKLEEFLYSEINGFENDSFKGHIR
jgi:hypothetical protein